MMVDQPRRIIIRRKTEIASSNLPPQNILKAQAPKNGNITQKQTNTIKTTKEKPQRTEEEQAERKRLKRERRLRHKEHVAATKAKAERRAFAEARRKNCNVDKIDPSVLVVVQQIREIKEKIEKNKVIKSFQYKSKASELSKPWIQIFPNVNGSIIRKIVYSNQEWVLEIMSENLRDPQLAFSKWFWLFSWRMRLLGEKRCREITKESFYEDVHNESYNVIASLSPETIASGKYIKCTPAVGILKRGFCKK